MLLKKNTILIIQRKTIFRQRHNYCCYLLKRLIKIPAKLDRCVKAVKKQNKKRKTKYNPYAVCRASINKSIKKGDLVNVKGFKEKMSVLSVNKTTIAVCPRKTCNGSAIVPKEWVSK